MLNKQVLKNVLLHIKEELEKINEYIINVSDDEGTNNEGDSPEGN